MLQQGAPAVGWPAGPAGLNALHNGLDWKAVEPPAKKAKPAKRPSSGGMCEDCGLVSKNYGLPSEERRRWCGSCGKKHGAVKHPGLSSQLGNSVTKAARAQKQKASAGPLDAVPSAYPYKRRVQKRQGYSEQELERASFEKQLEKERKEKEREKELLERERERRGTKSTFLDHAAMVRRARRTTIDRDQAELLACRPSAPSTQSSAKQRKPDFGADAINQHVLIYWPADRAWYPGRVVDFRTRCVHHQLSLTQRDPYSLNGHCGCCNSDNQHHVIYTDGDRGWERLHKESTQIVNYGPYSGAMAEKTATPQTGQRAVECTRGELARGTGRACRVCDAEALQGNYGYCAEHRSFGTISITRRCRSCAAEAIKGNYGYCLKHRNPDTKERPRDDPIENAGSQPDTNTPRAAGTTAKLCEDCGLLSRSFSLSSDTIRRWCGNCAKKHGAFKHAKKCTSTTEPSAASAVVIRAPPTPVKRTLTLEEMYAAVNSGTAHETAQQRPGRQDTARQRQRGGESLTSEARAAMALRAAAAHRAALEKEADFSPKKLGQMQDWLSKIRAQQEQNRQAKRKAKEDTPASSAPEGASQNPLNLATENRVSAILDKKPFNDSTSVDGENLSRTSDNVQSEENENSTTPGSTAILERALSPS